MAWELMNEGNAQPLAVRRAWVAEMSSYIKSLDHNHLVASGNANDKTLDLVFDLSVSSIDFGTWHGYPKYFGINTDQFNDLIPRYCEVAATYHKPVLLEEFGYARSHANQVAVYAKWLDTVTKDRN
jgi:mannan endo-1,4-beta-mannosidase